MLLPNVEMLLRLYYEVLDFSDFQQPYILVGRNELQPTYMLLERFIFTEDLDQIMEAPLRRLNWRLLPEGPMPWNQLQQHLNPIINAVPNGNQPFIIHRFEKINEFNPDFYAVGKAGFWGYIIFGFVDKNIYVCESIHYGNATYIFAEDWEELSKKTKAEILDNNLQEDRIIHRVGSWDRKIKQWLS